MHIARKLLPESADLASCGPELLGHSGLATPGQRYRERLGKLAELQPVTAMQPVACIAIIDSQSSTPLASPASAHAR